MDAMTLELQEGTEPNGNDFLSGRLLKSLRPFELGRVLAFAADETYSSIVVEALRIRAVETVLIDLFGKGKIHGTIHTCVGQELIGAFVGANLASGDFITSNHRCHGHFIGATGNWQGLIDEIVGNIDGVCAGIGSSQHLYSSNFMSNGQQGGLLPVAAGIALDRNKQSSGKIVISFIGEGTLGEGVLYETFNIASLWNLPHLIVCENNFYSQSTPQELSVAGEIGARASAFGIRVVTTDIWDPIRLGHDIAESMAFVRSSSRPQLLVIKAYRLNPHSKGDDNRNPIEIDYFRARDPLNVIMEHDERLARSYEDIVAETQIYASHALTKPRLPKERYLADQLPRKHNDIWTPREASDGALRIGAQLNQFYSEYLRSNERVFFLGEDIDDPYGGAFKIARGLKSGFPQRVITTPISEAAITGIGIGLALTGNRPLVEIMFGDFMTLVFDQIVNNASKFHHMYNKMNSCPIVVRTPMGGRRGYGPTHSQSLERFFVGIDNCAVISVNSLIDVHEQLSALGSLCGPAIVFENKVDYTLHPIRLPPELFLEVGNAEFPTIIVKVKRVRPTLTLVSYGNMARVLAENLLAIFDECDLIPELIVPTIIHPLDILPIVRSVKETGRLVVVEEGATCGGLGSEIIAQVIECVGPVARVLRIGAEAVPVPSVAELEEAVLPSMNRILRELCSFRARTV
jgi:2-oxoisovalerate dehydrogenase E1 component